MNRIVLFAGQKTVEPIRALTLLVCIAITIASSALAQSTNSVLTVIHHGKCWLKVGKKEQPCIPKLLNSNYPGGRTGFYITGKDDTIYTWSGASGHKPDSNSQVINVDQFIMSAKGETTGHPATGTCNYQNPYEGKPTRLTCKAQYANQSVEFKFEHDGSTPIDDVLPAP